jgi:hypothetical protein
MARRGTLVLVVALARSSPSQARRRRTAQPASGSVTIVWHVVSKADEIRARVTSSLHLG